MRGAGLRPVWGAWECADAGRSAKLGLGERGFFLENHVAFPGRVLRPPTDNGKWVVYTGHRPCRTTTFFTVTASSRGSTSEWQSSWVRVTSQRLQTLSLPSVLLQVAASFWLLFLMGSAHSQGSGSGCPAQVPAVETQ